MKKQILLLAIFTLAILAGTNTAWGQQLPPNTTPSEIDTLSCFQTAYPLHPVAGIPFTYKMDGESGEEDVRNWTWFVTKDSVFINNTGLNLANRLTAPGDLLSASTHYGSATPDADSVVITWSSDILSKTLYQGVASTSVFPSPTFVVGYGDGINCADNIEVYEINPKPSFVVDIANITESGTVLPWDTVTSECVDIIQSAVYNSATDSIDVDYGTDTLYFEVVAQNFVTSWTPYFEIIGGLSGSQRASIGIASSYANAQAGTFIAAEATGLIVGDSTSFGGIELTAADPADISNGVGLWVRVVIDNNTYESLTTQAFTLAVDGQDLSDQWDISEGDCSDVTAATIDYDDEAVSNILPRPAIDGDPANYPATTEDDGTTDPNNVIDKDRN